MISGNITFTTKVLIFTLLLLWPLRIYSQENDTLNIYRYIDNFNKNTVNNKEEKIYVFTDRPAYYTGDTIRFKANIFLAVTMEKEPVEKILYIELTGKNNFRLKRVYRINDGIVNGVFYLPDSTATGKYKLTAYTNWMLNNNGGDPFVKDILIYNQHYDNTASDNSGFLHENQINGDMGTDGEAEIMKDLTEQPDISVNFYPEGGTFVDGITSVMAFEVKDKTGKTIDAEGYIKDNGGNVVTFFKTLRGKGVFMITPDITKKYYAHVRGDHEKIAIPLPSPQKYGYVLNVTNNPGEDTLFFRISAKTPDVTGHHFYLLGIQNGIVKMALEGDVQEKSVFVIGNKKKFNTGIVRFTLLDEELIPRCERLSFINHYPGYNITVKVKDTLFSKKSKTDLDIYIKDSRGNPLSGEMALAVTDAGIIRDSLYGKIDIVNYLYFASDLPGISGEDMAFAMKKDETSHMFMNLIMLTNGWSRYKWEKITSLSDTIPEYRIEEKNRIEGIVKRKGSGNPAPKINISAYLKGEYNDFYTTKANAKGEFRFNLMDFYDTAEVVIQSLNRLNARTNYIFELRSNLPFIDTVKNDTLIRIIKEKPLFEFTFDEHPESFKLPAIKTIKRQRMNYDSEMAMVGDTSVILLDEVNVEAKKKKTPKEQMNEAYGSPDYVISGARIEKIAQEKGWLTNIFEIISYALPDVSIIVDHRKIDKLRDQEDGLMPGENDSISELDTESSHRFEFETNSALHYDTYRLPPKLMHIAVKDAGSPYYYIFFDGKYITSTNISGYLDIMRFPYMIFDLMYFKPRAVKSVEIIMNVKEKPKDLDDADFIDFARERGRPAIISIYTYDKQGLESNFGKRFRGMQKLKMLGFIREKEFYSPVYSEDDTTNIIDHRVTLYWDPKIKPDSTGHASVSFYNSDIATSLRFELSGMTTDNIPVAKLEVKGKRESPSGKKETERATAPFDFNGSSVTKKMWKDYRRRYAVNSTFAGIVVDDKGKPVPLADIYIKGPEIQTTANISGIFLLNKKETSPGDSIFISTPGNGYLAEKLENITGGNGVVRLKEQILSGSDATASELIPLITQKAKKDNAINRSFESVYRETIIQDGFIYSISDFRLLLEQYGYTRAETPHISELIKGRRFRTPDFHQTVVFKPVEPLSEDPDQLRDPVLDELELLKKPFLKNMTFTVEGKMLFRDRTVYRISFKQKENTIYSLYDGLMLVDTKDYGILYLSRTPAKAARSFLNFSSYLKNSEDFNDIKLIRSREIDTYKRINGKYVTKLQFYEVRLDLDGIPAAFIRELHSTGSINEKGRLFKKAKPLKNYHNRSLMVKDVIYDPSLWRDPSYLPPDMNMFNQAGYLHEISFYRKKK